MVEYLRMKKPSECVCAVASVPVCVCGLVVALHSGLKPPLEDLMISETLWERF